MCVVVAASPDSLLEYTEDFMVNATLENPLDVLIGPVDVSVVDDDGMYVAT